MFSIILLTLAVICSIVHTLSIKRKNVQRVTEIFLFYLLVICVGISGLFAFVGHAFRADEVARSIGWPTGSPFQFEVALANLAFGILGILCIWIRQNFWVATGIGYSIFLLGAAYGHIKQIIINHDFALNNAGPILYVGDMLIPLLILALPR